jgi:hypothetical protein
MIRKKEAERERGEMKGKERDTFHWNGKAFDIEYCSQKRRTSLLYIELAGGEGGSWYVQ